MLNENYSSDSPVTDPQFDRFNRYQFSKRVAQVISKRDDPSSIVIGLYGAWGNGKTSVLNFIEGQLDNEDKVVCMKFNPWRFGTEDEMLIYFFHELSKTIERTIISKKEKLGGAIEKFAKPIAAIAGKSAVIDGVQLFFSQADVQDLRKRIEEILQEEKKRIVILIDDIDRLDKNEVHTLFRLVKLTADFNYTAYILAFDKDVVSSALSEKFGGSSTKLGSSFIEKIIQVPLSLPILDGEDLRSFYVNEIMKVLLLSNIELSDVDLRNFMLEFTGGLEGQLRTPRQVKMYSNTLMFVLPILQDEVNTVDLMLLEGIKVLLPELYSLIYENPSLFLENTKYGMGFEQSEKEKRKKQLEDVLEGISNEKKEKLKGLLFFLFPKLSSLYKNNSFSTGSEVKWSENKRVCSSNYFKRYFTYAISATDISDIAIGNLIARAENQSVDEVIEDMQTIMTEKNASKFVSKLRALSTSFTSQQSKILAIAMAQIGGSLPNPIEFLRMFNSYGQAAAFTGDCIENLEDREERKKLATEIIKQASSLSFALESYRWFRRDTDERPNPNGFNDYEYSEVEKVLANRIKWEMRNNETIDTVELEWFPSFLTIWKKYEEAEEIKITMDKKIQRNPAFLFDLLSSYTATVSSDYGTEKSSFRKENYDSIERVLDVDEIASEIKKIYSEFQEDDLYPECIGTSRQEMLARQFLWFYKKADG
jgi:predicted KAP-like P-loop ATPase